MQPTDPQLSALRAELEHLGYVVVPHGAHLCVRLPLLCSVVVRVDEGRFRFRPQFGPFGRTGGLLATSAVSVGAVGAAALAVGTTPLAFVAAFLGVVLLAHDGCRFVLTEGCLTRLQQLLTTHHPLPAGAAAAALGEGVMPTLAAGRETAVGHQRGPVTERS